MRDDELGYIGLRAAYEVHRSLVGSEMCIGDGAGSVVGHCRSPIESGGGAKACRVFRDGSWGELSRRAQCFVANPFLVSC